MKQVRIGDFYKENKKPRRVVVVTAIDLDKNHVYVEYIRGFITVHTVDFFKCSHTKLKSYEIEEVKAGAL